MAWQRKLKLRRNNSITLEKPKAHLVHVDCVVSLLVLVLCQIFASHVVEDLLLFSKQKKMFLLSLM
jgi:hypothetical protein